MKRKRQIVKLYLKKDTPEEERLRKLNRNEWEKEYDDYLDWHEKEEIREEMMKNIDSMLLKPTEKNI